MKLSPADADYLRRSCEQSGVPVRITDPVLIARTADLLRNEDRLRLEAAMARAARTAAIEAAIHKVRTAATKEHRP